MELEKKIILSKVTQTQKDICGMYSPISVLKKRKIGLTIRNLILKVKFITELELTG